MQGGDAGLGGVRWKDGVWDSDRRVYAGRAKRLAKGQSAVTGRGHGGPSLAGGKAWSVPRKKRRRCAGEERYEGGRRCVRG